MEIVSTLAQIAPDIFAAKSLTAAQEIFSKHISESKIKAEDKAKMLLEGSQMKSLTQLQRYLANALLKYEGLGTGL